MTPGKRKRNDFEDEDEDEPSYGRQILPVAELPDDFNDEPLDGMQYLFMVRCGPSTVSKPCSYQNIYNKKQTRCPAFTPCHKSSQSLRNFLPYSSKALNNYSVQSLALRGMASAI
jgi:hypothetical protein